MDAERLDRGQGDRLDGDRAVGFLYVAPDRCHAGTGQRLVRLLLADFGLAMIFVLFAYGGWNEMAFVAGEVKEPRKNILRALRSARWR